MTRTDTDARTEDDAAAEALRAATRRADRRRIGLSALLFAAGGGSALGLGVCMTDAVHCGMFNVFGGALMAVAAGFAVLAARA